MHIFAVEFVMNCMREAACLFGSDYDCAMIFLAVVQSNGRVAIRDPSHRVEYADLRDSIPAELVRPVSLQAIAESLGMSRESVRRKVRKLIEPGYLSKDARGGVITARGVIARAGFLKAEERIFGYLRRFWSELRQHGASISN